MVPEEDSKKSCNLLTSNNSVSCEKLPYPGRTQKFRGWWSSTTNVREHRVAKQSLHRQTGYSKLPSALMFSSKQPSKLVVLPGEFFRIGLLQTLEILQLPADARQLVHVPLP